MAIYVNPYLNGDIISFDDGSSILKRNTIDYNPSAGKDIVHTVMENDTIWGIANLKYGDDKWWYVIADANGLYNPFILTLGQDLIIPDLDIVKATS